MRSHSHTRNYPKKLDLVEKLVFNEWVALMKAWMLSNKLEAAAPLTWPQYRERNR